MNLPHTADTGLCSPDQISAQNIIEFGSILTVRSQFESQQYLVGAKVRQYVGLSNPKKILVLGNCQTGGLTACLALLQPDCQVSGLAWSADDDVLKSIANTAAAFDVVVTSAPVDLRSRMVDYGLDESKFFVIPSLHFAGFHPDLCWATVNEQPWAGGVSDVYQSAIGIWCWKQGMEPKAAERLFVSATMRELGYDRFWQVATNQSRAHFSITDVPFTEVFLPLQSSGLNFMHSTNHPSISAIAQLARAVARKLGASEKELQIDVTDVVSDALIQHVVWPIYPGVGEALGLAPNLVWKNRQAYYDLSRFLETQFAALDGAEGPVVCEQADTPHFDAAMRRAMAA